MATGALAAVHRWCNNERLRRGLLRLRFPLGLLAGAAAIWYANPIWFWPAATVSLIGALLQDWCFASLNKNRELAVCGPYALVRNPMYIARFIVILGLVLLPGWPWLAVIYTVAYYFYVVNRVQREETKLREVFGAPYAEYCRQVRRFLPVFRPYPGSQLAYFRWELFIRNHGWASLVGVIALYAIAWARLHWR
jgi:protein-S-isoprenylcysteine O-methyltransferase Ste14